MDTPHGPIKIQTNRQIALPKDVLDLMKLGPGDRVYVVVDEASPRWMRVIPADLVMQWLSRGEAEQ